jgi:hypothetical protein
MEETIQRIVGDLFGRLDGPLHFRFIFQPLMAVIFAVLDGLKDSKAGKPAYFWALFSTPEKRREMLSDGWGRIGKVFIIAIILDVAYQLFVIRWFYPFETALVAFILAIVPYLLVRGPVNRIASLTSKN